MNTSKRLDYLDMAKGIGIFFVALGHMEDIYAENRFFPKLDLLYEAGEYEGIVILEKSPEYDKIDICLSDHKPIFGLFEVVI